MTAVSIDIADKRYTEPGGGTREVLRDLHLTLQPDELVCLFGPSGCGKTTVLNIVAGLDTDFSGAVQLSGRTDGSPPVVGYVFQQPRLLPWLTVEQNLTLVARDAAARARVPELIAVTGLSGHPQSYPRHLSGGLARRAALARALVVDPDLLLLDEPFVSLDMESADRLRRHLRGLLDNRPTTALFVTHDLREAALLADRVLFLSASPSSLVGELRIGDAPADRFDEAWLAETVRALTARQSAAVSGY